MNTATSTIIMAAMTIGVPITRPRREGFLINDFTVLSPKEKYMSSHLAGEFIREWPICGQLSWGF